MKYEAILSPYVLNKKLVVKNRTVLAPMTNSQSYEDGIIGYDEIAWLEQCAEGDFGIIITACASISLDAKGFDGQLSIANDSFIPGLHRLIQRLKKFQSINIIQLCHPGSRAPSRLNHLQPVAPSVFELQLPNFEVPRALDEKEIPLIVEQFATAAIRAAAAGFNGIEILGANGYLVTQFISQSTNKRLDSYGGTLENRARFVRDIIKACRKQTPEDFIVGLRISPEGPGLDIDENRIIAQWAKDDGADYIHLSSVDWEKTAEPYPEQKIVQLFRVSLGDDFPIILTGGIQTPDEATAALASGASFVGLGRIAIGNPDWPRRIANDIQYQPRRPPYTTHYLKQIGITDRFIEYIRKVPLPIIAEDEEE
ncbi:HisA/HisF-related TIM barrel protein [Yersinia intermedia]|uniref:oxidoreductase n=1 Tax=Yersinia intermedia TaxID=631 RepID=UPI0005DB4BC5|nr:HisA/HisF-related TIM barrel protein [Yersinia intermedia]CND47457.1 N-ethylmaleimide reductase [Yersinia intermedia]